MAINVTTSKQQITAAVADEKITATVQAGIGATGPQGPVGAGYTLPVAGASLGGVKSGGTGITIDNAGVISVTSGAYATLVNGTVPSNQLPSYVDDIVEVSTYGSLPSPGETGKIYVVTQTNKVYRWSGFVYIEIVASPGSTDSLAEGSVNLYYTNARAAAAAPVQSVNGQTGNVTIASYSLPKATASVLGGVKAGGSGISIDGDGVISATVSSLAWADITGKPSDFTPSSHSHGNITNDGKVGTAADKVLVTTSAGAVTATSSITYSQVASTSTYTNFSTTPGDLHSSLLGIDSAISGKAATSHAHAWSDITSGVPSTFTPPEMSDTVTGGAKLGGGVWVSGGRLQANFRSDDPGLGNEYSNYQYKDVVLYNAKLYQCTDTGGAHGGPAGPTAARWTQVVTASDIGAAAVSHTHSATADLTFAGATAGQVLTVNGSGTALVWATPTTYTLPQATGSTLGGITVSTGLSVASGALSVSYGTSSGTACQGNDARLSDARTPTAHNHAASDINSGVIATARLASSGTASSTTFLRGDQTWASAGSTSASDLTTGTLSDSRLSINAQAAINLYLWSAFR